MHNNIISLQWTIKINITANLNDLLMMVMIAEDPSYYLTRTSFVVHWTIKFIYIPWDVATSSNIAWSRATKKCPPPIFMMVAMVAGYSTNVVVWRALELHWLVMSRSTLDNHDTQPVCTANSKLCPHDGCCAHLAPYIPGIYIPLGPWHCACSCLSNWFWYCIFAWALLVSKGLGAAYVAATQKKVL